MTAFRRASLAGAVAGLAAFMFMAILGFASLIPKSIVSGFYETQASSLRQGHWWFPTGRLGVEEFRIGGRSFMYFGPWPALLRMPFMLLAHGMDGRWTIPSMIVALTVGLLATARLGWLTRGLIRPDAVFTRAEWWSFATFLALVGGGSVFTVLVSQAWVYHEAEIWGACAALAAFACILDHIRSPRWNTVVLASAFSTVSILSRPSVGFGPVSALGMIAVAGAFAATRRAFGVRSWDRLGHTWRAAAASLVAAALPAALYTYVNYAKFGTWLVFPSDKQVYSRVSVYRRTMLADNGGSLFGLKFLPTAALQYLRPDGLRFRPLFPFVDFPATTHVFGGVRFDTIEPTASAVATMPIFVALAVVGVIAAFWPDRRNRGGGRSVRIPILAALLGAYTVVPYSYIAQRYESDFMPLLVVAGLVGLWTVMAWSAGRHLWGRAVLSVAAVLAVFMLWANCALSLTYRKASDFIPEGPSSQFVSTQYRLHSAFPGGAPPSVRTADSLPTRPGARGSVVVLGACRGVYYSLGNAWEQTAKWHALARTRSTGEYRFRVSFRHQDARTTMPVVVRGDAVQHQFVAAIVQPNDRVRFAFGATPSPWSSAIRPNPDGLDVGQLFHFVPGRTYDLEVTMDSNTGTVGVVIDGRPTYRFVDLGLTTPAAARVVLPTEDVSIGSNTVADGVSDRFDGTLEEVHQDRPSICRWLLPADGHGRADG
jgi:hypothetical protein